MLENIKIDGYAMIRPILEQEDIVESTKVLKKLVDNNKKKYKYEDKKTSILSKKNLPFPSGLGHNFVDAELYNSYKHQLNSSPQNHLFLA